MPSHAQPWDNCNTFACPANPTPGLSSLMDALSLGRVVLMTSNCHIDIEAIGIGFLLHAGDVRIWVRCPNWMQDNPAEIDTMKRRASQMTDKNPDHINLLANELN